MGRWRSGYRCVFGGSLYFGQLLPHPAALVGVQAVVADQMGSLGRNGLRELRAVIDRFQRPPGSDSASRQSDCRASLTKFINRHTVTGQ